MGVSIRRRYRACIAMSYSLRSTEGFGPSWKYRLSQTKDGSERHTPRNVTSASRIAQVSSSPCSNSQIMSDANLSEQYKNADMNPSRFSRDPTGCWKIRNWFCGFRNIIHVKSACEERFCEEESETLSPYLTNCLQLRNLPVDIQYR